MKIDWLELESRIRLSLRTAKDHKDAKDLALLMEEISDALGDETGRGYELPKDWWRRFE